MFIDTLAFLLTRKRVDKRKKKKDIHLSTTTKEKLLQRMIHLVLSYACACVCFFYLSLKNNGEEDDDVVVKQSIVPIEFHKACGWRRRSLLHIVPIVTREHPSIPSKKTNSEKINCCYCCYYANEKATSFAFSLAAKYGLYCLLMCV